MGSSGINAVHGNTSSPLSFSKRRKQPRRYKSCVLNSTKQKLWSGQPRSFPISQLKSTTMTPRTGSERTKKSMTKTRLRDAVTPKEFPNAKNSLELTARHQKKPNQLTKRPRVKCEPLAIHSTVKRCN